MSKIGKKSIVVPPGVTVNVKDGNVFVKGPKGELNKLMPSGIGATVENGMIMVKTNDASGRRSEMWGLTRALIANMITGVSSGFQKTLEFSGVGYKAQIRPASPARPAGGQDGKAGGGDTLEMNLGFSHPVIIQAPRGITFQVEKNLVTITGINKEAVGHVAALVRAARPPEPYKGSGVKYKDEIIRKKAGKKAAGATGTP